MQNKTLQMKRAMRTALLVLLLSVVGMTKMYAYDFSAVCETGQTLYYNITDVTNHYVALTCPGDATYNNCWTGFTRPMGSIIFSESVQYEEIVYTITSIGNYAFYGCSGFTGSLTIPNSVSSIGSYAFYNCSGFTDSLTIPNSVTTISPSAFENCSGFTGGLTIPNSVTTIGFAAFANCSGFTGSLTIPNSVTTIDGYAFANCSGFTGSLTISNSVTTIDGYAFYNCSGFTDSLTIPNSVTTIGPSAFENCSGFTGSLTIPNSVTSIYNGAFFNCSGFTGSLTIPNSMTTIGGVAFYGCSGFTGSLTIPDSVTTIGFSAFENCSGFIGNLIIPNSVTTIGESAFSGCSGFTGNLIIPNSVTSIEESTFYDCSGFTGDLNIPNSVTTIKEFAFLGCSGLNGLLTLPNSITSIGGNAFIACDFDTIVSLSVQPPVLEEYSFDDYTKLIVCCGSKEAYEASDWVHFFNLIEEDCTPHAVTIDEGNMSGGDVSASTNYSELGEEVQLTVTPDEGMELTSLIISNANNPSQAIPVYPFGKASSTWGFIMPPFDVVITATFEETTFVPENNSILASVYPNPTMNIVKIEAEDLKHIIISNTIGQIIYEGKASGDMFEYDFGSHGAGLYLIRIETASELAVKKVSVVR